MPQSVSTPYLKNVVKSRWIYDPGTLSLPRGIPAEVFGLDDLDTLPATPPAVDTLDIVQTSAPTLHRIMEFEILRIGDAPDIPNPVSENVNEQLIHMEVTTFSPGYTDDGVRQIFGVTGRYTYAWNNPQTWLEGLAIPTVPVTSPAVDVINSSDLYATD